LPGGSIHISRKLSSARSNAPVMGSQTPRRRIGHAGRLTSVGAAHVMGPTKIKKRDAQSSREVSMLVPPRFSISLLLSALILSYGCARNQDSGQRRGPGPQYFLISVNMQIPYWQTAGAGFKKAASELHVRAEVAGPNNYDPKAEKQEFSRIVKLKPSPGMTVTGPPLTNVCWLAVADIWMDVPFASELG